MAAVESPFDSDDDLVAALRKGDETAFAWLLDTYGASLRRVALSFVPSPALADEVVQEAWLGVIKGLDRFEQRSSLKTWIYQIVMNIARTKGSRESRTIPFSSAGDNYSGVFPEDRFRPEGEEWGGWWANPARPWEPADLLDRAETMRHICDAIAGLPATQRAVLSLRDIDGWTSEEVCNVLDISPTNQRVLLHRARVGVRAKLNPYLEAEIDG